MQCMCVCVYVWPIQALFVDVRYAGRVVFDVGKGDGEGGGVSFVRCSLFTIRYPLLAAHRSLLIIPSHPPLPSLHSF